MPVPPAQADINNVDIIIVPSSANELFLFDFFLRPTSITPINPIPGS